MAVGDANARLLLAVTTIGLGYCLRRLGLVDVDVGKSLLKVLFNATLPCVLLMTFASLTFDGQSVAVLVCGLGQAIVLFVAQLAFRGKDRPPKELALLAGSCVGVNLGTFCYPLVEAVWGVEGLSRVVLFDAVNQWSLLIVAPLIYASSIAGASFSPIKALMNVRKQLLSPCLLAMFLAVALRLMGWTLPEPVTALTSSLAVANKPLALIALGILFDPRLKDGQLRDICALLALRYGASLLLGALILTTLSASMGAATTAVVLAALISPVPLLTVTYAMEYDCDIGLGASAVNAGNFCSFALLLAVANADFGNPTALAPAVAATGLLLTLFGVLGSKRGGPTMGGGGGINVHKLTRARSTSSSSCPKARRNWRSHPFVGVGGVGGIGGVGRVGGRGALVARRQSRDRQVVHAPRLQAPLTSVNVGANISAASSRGRTGYKLQKCSGVGRSCVVPPICAVSAHSALAGVGIF